MTGQQKNSEHNSYGNQHDAGNFRTDTFLNIQLTRSGASDYRIGIFVPQDSDQCGSIAVTQRKGDQAEYTSVFLFQICFGIKLRCQDFRHCPELHERIVKRSWFFIFKQKTKLF